MPMEHLNEHGELSQGYYCSKCGLGCGMYGHQNNCEANIELAKKVREINDAGSIEQYIFNKLKGEYDE